MSVFNAMNVSASGLTAERLRMDVVAGNIANANTTRTEEGGAYRRKVAVFEEYLASSMNSSKKKVRGVMAKEIVEDPSEMELVYNPTHPDADENGYVEMPNVDLLTEMTDLMVATRSYEANVTALNASKGMYVKALEIGR